tara:strand:- start:494 stop:883 length:390 start_codon:yes stop_codon:yes gene_type:complete
MTDVSTGVIAGTAVLGMTAASFVPGVDSHAVIGAFAGALFFMVFAKDLTALARLGYFFASWIAGYYFSVETVGQSWFVSSGLPAFFGSLLVVVICISLLEWVEGGKVPGWLAWIVNVIRPSNGNGNGNE